MARTTVLIMAKIHFSPRSRWDMAHILPDFDRKQARDKTGQVDHERSRFPVSRIVGCRTKSRVPFFFPCFLPIGLSDPCSHRRKNKTQVALSGHHRHHGTWSTRCCRYLSPIEDTYLLLVPRERNLLPLGTTATILPRSCPVRRVTSELRAGDRYNGCLAYNPLFYKNHHVNCSDRNKNTWDYFSLTLLRTKKRTRTFTRIIRECVKKDNIFYFFVRCKQLFN